MFQIYFPDKAGEGPDSRSSNTVWGAVLGSAAAIVALVGIVLVGRYHASLVHSVHWYLKGTVSRDFCTRKEQCQEIFVP